MVAPGAAASASLSSSGPPIGSNLIRAECEQFVSFSACAGCCDRNGPFGLHNLYGGETSAAGSRRDENELSLLHLAKLNQCSVGRHVLHPDGSCFDWREM